MPAPPLEDASASTARSLYGTADGPVIRAFSVLERLASSREPLRLSAIARELSLQKSTVHRMLSLLVGLGYAEQVKDTGCYRATLRTWELGQAIILEHPVKRAAGAFLQELHRATRETVSLVILSGDDVLYLDKLFSPRPIRFTTRVGSRVPAPLTAGGKAILAHDPDARAIVKRVAARAGRSSTIKVDKLMRELASVRELGYSTSSYSPGALSIAAPVLGHAGQAAAAISISAPIARVNAKKKAEIIEHVLSVSAQITERVGVL